MTDLTALPGSPRSPTGSGSPATTGSTSTSPSSAATAACSSSTPTPPTRAARRSIDGRTPPRRRRGDRRRQHPRALRPHLRQRRVPRRRTARCRSTPTRTAAERTVEAGERIKAAATPPTRRPARARRCWRPRIVPADHDVLLRAVARPRRPGWSSWSTPGAATPRGDLVVRVPDADVLLAGDLVEESGPPVSATTATRWSGRSASTSCSACTTGDRRRARPRRAVDRDFVEDQRNDDRHRRRDDPRPRLARRAGRRRRSRPASGPTRATAWCTPSAAATSTSPAARSGSR